METIVRTTRTDKNKGRRRMRFVFRITPSEAAQFRANYRAVLREMQDERYIASYGCDCSICEAGGDCCGHFTLSSMKSVLAGDRLIVLQTFYRNL